MLLYQNIFGGMRRHEQPPTFGGQGGGGDPLILSDRELAKKQVSVVENSEKKNSRSLL